MKYIYSANYIVRIYMYYNRYWVYDIKKILDLKNYTFKLFNISFFHSQ